MLCRVASNEISTAPEPFTHKIHSLRHPSPNTNKTRACESPAAALPSPFPRAGALRATPQVALCYTEVSSRPMTERFQFLAYAARMAQLAAVLLDIVIRMLWRRMRRRPTQGPALVREAFEKLSGSFIKFGQILSLQIDTLPREY